MNKSVDAQSIVQIDWKKVVILSKENPLRQVVVFS